MIDEKLIDRVYDRLPRLPNSEETYYSRSAIRLILEAEANIVGAAFSLTDTEPCPIPPPGDPFGLAATAATDIFATTQAIAEANAAMCNVLGVSFACVRARRAAAANRPCDKR